MTFITQQASGTMGRMLLLIVLFLGSHNLYSQPLQGQGDSLIASFNRLPDANEKVSQYYHTLRRYGFHVPLSYNRHVRTWAQDRGIDSVVASTYQNAAEIYFFALEDPDSAFFSNEKQRQIYQALGKVERVAWAHFQRGFFYNSMSLYSQANVEFIAALAAFSAIDHPTGLYRTHRKLGVLHVTLDNYRKAQFHFGEALSIARQTHDSTKIALVTLNLGTSYLDSVVQKYAHLSFYEVAPEDVQILDSLSFPLLSEALQLSSRLGNKGYIALAEQNLGTYHRLKHNLDEAIRLHKRVLDFRLKEGNAPNTIATRYNSLGHNYFKKAILDGLPSYLDSAYQSLTTGRQYCALHPEVTRHQQREIFSNLQFYFEEVHRYDSAYYYLYSYDTLNQAIFNLEKEKEIQDVNGRYEYEKQQRTIADQQREIAVTETRLTRNYFTIGILSLLSVSALVILFINRSRLRAKALVSQQEIQLVHQKMEDLVRQSELRTINALLEGQEKERERLSQELHDSVGSVLSAIKLHFTGMTQEMEALQAEARQTFERGTHLLDVAVEEVRRISHNMTTGVLRKFGLVVALEDLQGTLQGTGQIDFQLFVHGMDDRLEGQLEINLYRVVQELVSNTLKHAKASTITVEINRREEEINVMVSDDGVGFDRDAIESDGIGLANMHGRIEKLGGQLHIDSTPGRGTTAVIDIPLNDE